MTQKIIFITYGDSKKYSVSKKHLIDLAEYSNFFDECLGFSNTDLDFDCFDRYSKRVSNIRFSTSFPCNSLKPGVFGELTFTAK